MRALALAVTWCLLLLAQFVVSHVVEREGLAGALLASEPGLLPLAALATLLALRILCVVVLPAALFASLVLLLLRRLLRQLSKARRTPRAALESSAVERSTLGE